MPQKVIEQGAKIGLDDVELTLHHRHNFGKIIDDFRQVTRSLALILLAISAQVWIVSRWMLIVLPNNPGCRSRTGYPPHF